MAEQVRWVIHEGKNMYYNFITYIQQSNRYQHIKRVLLMSCSSRAVHVNDKVSIARLSEIDFPP